jgi:hypothetical protein
VVNLVLLQHGVLSYWCDHIGFRGKDRSTFQKVYSLEFSTLKKMLNRSWWFMPAILATWEAKVRRIVVQGQLVGVRVAEFIKPLSQPTAECCGMYLSSQLHGRS